MFDRAARYVFEEARWPGGVVCPHCRAKGRETRLRGAAHRPGLYQCNACRRQYTVTVNTPLHRTRLSLGMWFQMLLLLRDGVSIRQIQLSLGIGSYETAHRAAWVLRDFMDEDDCWLRAIVLGPLPLGRVCLRAAQRPRTRDDCANGERPCPWVSCRHHLYFIVKARKGALPTTKPWDMDETCALDIADRGGSTLQEVGDALGFTREMIRRIEASAIANLTQPHRGAEQLWNEAEEAVSTADDDGPMFAQSP